MNIFEFVKSKIAILDVIQEYVTLKPAGKYWKGPSPFRSERVPSFTVSPHKEIYYCFSSGQGGDVISFIASIENCTQLEAVQYLLDRYKIQIPATIEWNKNAIDITKKTTYEKTCDFFAQWCHSMLATNAGSQKYLAQRGISQSTINTFTVGYCPVGEDALKSMLSLAQKSSLLRQDFLEAQILMDGRQGLYAPFEDRIVFPIYNHLGACCGFGGRVFKEHDTRAKYYNSHDHDYFNKSTIIFGLNAAKKSIQKQGHAFLVEGYLDCITMVQAGYTNTVATLGTACTIDHLKQLSRYAHTLYVMYDGDDAGQKAMIRLAELCWQVNLELFIITLPPTEDPASFLMSGKNLEPLIASAPDIFVFFIEHVGSQFFSKSLQERLTTLNQLLDTLAQLPDALQRDLLLHKMATTFDTSFETLKMQMQKKKIQPNKAFDEPELAEIKTSPFEGVPPLEKKLFAAILNSDVPLEQGDEQFILKHISPALALLLHKYHDHNHRFDMFFNTLTEEEQRLVSSSTVEYGQDNGAHLLQKLLEEFHRQQWKIRVHEVKMKLAQSSNASQEEQEKILLEFHELKKNSMRKDKGIS